MKLVGLNKSKKQGFTLIEILLVVGFIAVAGIGVYTIYAKVQQGQAANAEARNIDTIRAGVKGLFAGASDTTGLTNTVINNGSVTPQPMRVAGNAALITNSFGGAVTVAPVTLVAGNDGFRITYPSVPVAVCTKLVTGPGSQFEQVTVAGTVVKAIGTVTAVNIAAATTQCATDAGTGVTILFDSLK